MLEMTYAVQLSFLDLTGRTVASRDVDHVILRSSAGGRVDLPGGATAHLAGMRVVSLTGRLEPKPISWTVDSIWVAGANVVHRSQVRFRPNATRSLPVQLLFFSADVSGHDALFGFHVGHAALITGPNGKARRYNFGKGSHVHLARLPRGTYTVRIVGPGWSFERPVALSRNQDVDLEVLTWLDVAFAALVFGGGAVALVLIGRPHLRRRVSPRRHGRLHLVASERADD